MKKMIFAILAVTILLGSGTTVLAEEEHNYNIFVSEVCRNTYSYGHTHYMGGPDYTTVPVNCQMTVYIMKRTMKCYCGATQTTEYTITHHSVYD